MLPVWEAFFELSTDRPIGFSVGPIPFSSLHLYAERHGLDDAVGFDRFRRSIRAMDKVYLDHAAQQAKRKGK